MIIHALDISNGSGSSHPISQTVFSLEPRHSFLIRLNYCDNDDDDDVDDDEDDDDDGSAAAKMLMGGGPKKI